MGDHRISINESNYQTQMQVQHINYRRIQPKTATLNKVQQKDDDLTSKTPEPYQTNQDHNNPSNNLITPSNITKEKSQIAQNQTAIATDSPNIDDNNTSIDIKKNHAECNNNSINGNVTKEADKGQSHKVAQLEKDQEKHHCRNTKKGDFITINEMEDMTLNKEQTSSPTKSLTTSTEKRTQEKRKQDDNHQSTYVTREMYNNLKRTINRMDNEINKFSKRYSVEQSVTTEEITDILKNFITPLTEENAQHKLELEAAKQKN